MQHPMQAVTRSMRKCRAQWDENKKHEVKETCQKCHLGMFPPESCSVSWHSEKAHKLTNSLSWILSQAKWEAKCVCLNQHAGGLNKWVWPLKEHMRGVYRGLTWGSWYTSTCRAVVSWLLVTVWKHLEMQLGQSTAVVMRCLKLTSVPVGSWQLSAMATHCNEKNCFPKIQRTKIYLVTLNVLLWSCGASQFLSAYKRCTKEQNEYLEQKGTPF